MVIADKDAEKSGALARSVDPTGTRVIAIPTDIESEESVLALFAQLRTRFDRLDILVNCAGVTANMDLLETPWTSSTSSSR